MTNKTFLGLGSTASVVALLLAVCMGSGCSARQSASVQDRAAVFAYAHSLCAEHHYRFAYVERGRHDLPSSIHCSTFSSDAPNDDPAIAQAPVATDHIHGIVVQTSTGETCSGPMPPNAICIGGELKLSPAQRDRLDGLIAKAGGLLEGVAQQE